jgi:hypothetical protein
VSSKRFTFTHITGYATWVTLESRIHNFGADQSFPVSFSLASCLLLSYILNKNTKNIHLSPKENKIPRFCGLIFVISVFLRNCRILVVTHLHTAQLVQWETIVSILLLFTMLVLWKNYSLSFCIFVKCCVSATHYLFYLRYYYSSD